MLVPAQGQDLGLYHDLATLAVRAGARGVLQRKKRKYKREGDCRNAIEAAESSWQVPVAGARRIGVPFAVSSSA